MYIKALFLLSILFFNTTHPRNQVYQQRQPDSICLYFRTTSLKQDMPSTMDKPLHLQDIARLYLGYLNYPDKAIVNLVASRSSDYINEHVAGIEHGRALDKAKKKYPTPEQFGKYLAHGQWNLDCLSFAIRFTDDDINKVISVPCKSGVYQI